MHFEFFGELRMTKKKTILFIMSRLPFPASSGRKTSLYHYCRILSEQLGYRLVVAAFLEDGDDPRKKTDFIDELIILPKASVKKNIFDIVINSVILRKKPMQVVLYWSPEAKKIVNHTIKKEKPQYVIGDMVRSTEYIRDVNSFRIADLDDRISLRYKRQLENDIDEINPYGNFLYSIPKWFRVLMLAKPVKLMVMKNEVALLEKYEREIGSICEKTVFVAEKEAYDFNRELNQEKAIAIPIGVDIDYFYYRETKKKGNIIGFLGAMGVAHNENAVRHFIDNMLSLILKEVPDALFMIIGGGASNDLLKMESKHIHFTGKVDDVREYLEQCKVFVCPMTFGSGIKTKNLEAMAMGLPIVTTSIGAENIGATNKVDWFIDDDSRVFAKDVILLLKDDNRRKEIGRNASEYIREKWTWNATKNAFQLLLG